VWGEGQLQFGVAGSRRPETTLTRYSWAGSTSTWDVTAARSACVCFTLYSKALNRRSFTRANSKVCDRS